MPLADVEQVAECGEPEDLAPSRPAVLLSIVEELTHLAERGEVVGPVTAEIVVQLRRGQDHAYDQKTWGRGHACEAGLLRLKRIGQLYIAHPSRLGSA